MVADEMVFIPTADGIVTLSAADGKVIPKPPVTPPDLRELLKNDAVRAALATAGALDRLGGKDANEADGNDPKSPRPRSPKTSSPAR